MKTIVAIVALATLIAAPAFAQSGKNARTQAYAQQRQQTQTQRHSTNLADDVYVNGQYVGFDPDLMIRAQLQRDVGTSD